MLPGSNWSHTREPKVSHSRLVKRRIQLRTDVRRKATVVIQRWFRSLQLFVNKVLSGLQTALSLPRFQGANSPIRSPKP